jgi:predicted dehydrogenase
VVRLGIIGCGWVTESAHLPVLERVANVQLVAACDARPERLSFIERKYPSMRLHEDAMELLRDPGIDAVLIATPADSHLPIAVAAMEEEKHVLLEKPLALTLRDAEELARRERDSKRVNMMGFNYRFHPLAIELKAALGQEAIGRTVAAVTTMCTVAGQRPTVSGYDLDSERGGGVFHDKVVHAVDLFRFWFDCDIADARATARSEHHHHDLATIELEFENGVRCTGLFCDHAATDHEHTVFGEKGKAAINFSRPSGVDLYLREYSRNRLTKLRSHFRQLKRLNSAIRLSSSKGRLAAYRNEWIYFLSCVDRGARPCPGFQDGLAATRAVVRMLESLDRTP